MACKRRYYYSYYASYDDPEIRRLKKLSALPLWAGNVVHETIEQILTAHDQPPSPTQQEALIREAVHVRMLAEWNQSNEGTDGFRLFEHEYDVPVEAEDKKILVGIVRRSLRNFFSSATAQAAYAVGRDNWLTIEDLVSYNVSDDVPVYLRMDLAYRDQDGTVVIVDWKTGRSEGRFSETQLSGYALYALKQGWAKEPEQIQTELAYLAIPRYVRRTMKSQTLTNAESFIKKSAANMKALIPDPTADNATTLANFPMIDRPNYCRRCNFRRLCFPRT